jgi:hypothetical protein
VPSFQLDRLPETDDELWLLVKLLWGVTIPREQVCADHCAPFTAFADAFFRRNSLNPDSDVDSIALWWGSRGLSGKSFMLAILGLTIAYLLGGDVNILGGSLAQSTNVHEHMRAAMESSNAPGYMVLSQGVTEIKLHNKSKLRPLTASQRTVRGPHPPTLLCVAGWTKVETPEGYVQIDSLTEGRTVRVSSNMTTSSWGIVQAVVD